jgi:hypothetical protein
MQAVGARNFRPQAKDNSYISMHEAELLFSITNILTMDRNVLHTAK